MICIAAAIVFGVLALCSAKYRPLAKEAWSCVFLKVTLRPCQSGLDRRVRTGALISLSKRSPVLGKFVYKIFPALSVFFVLLTIVSFGYLVYGGYNYAMYGNCNGPGSSGFCVFDPNGPGTSEVAECSEKVHEPSVLIPPSEDALSAFKTVHPDGKTTVIFIGCYSCQYTREAAPALWSVIDSEPTVKFVLVDFPLTNHANASLAANAANCAYDQNPAAYPAYARLLYRAQLANGLPARADIDTADTQAALALDFDLIAACAAKPHSRVTAGTELGSVSGVYGTPTYFIGAEGEYKAFVGPLNARALRKLIRDARD